MCNHAKYFAELADKFKYPVFYGEWSLATDNCAQNVNGLNSGDINSNFECAMMECPKTYMPDEFKSEFDFDRSADMPSPQGDGDNKRNSIQKGLCVTDSLKFNQT
jgi:hypothetical protein